VQTIRAQSSVINPVVLRSRSGSEIIERDMALETINDRPMCRFHLRRKFKVVWPDGAREVIALDVYHPVSLKTGCIGASGSARPGGSPAIRTSPYKKFGGRGRLVRGGRCPFDRRLKEQASWAGIGNGSYSKTGEIIPLERPIAPEVDADAGRALIAYWRGEGVTPYAVDRHAAYYADEMSRRNQRESK
jgi:hypothetical protein